VSRKILYRADVAHAVQRAVNMVASGGWIVLVCPDGSEFHSAFLSCAGGVFPNGVSFSGRTAILPGGGKVSVLPVSATPFTNAGPFDVMFLGWSDDDAADNRRMAVWRAASHKVLL
jgi:hypothetical protein